MNTTQNTQRIIATALLAVTAFALTSCAGQQQSDTESGRNSHGQTDRRDSGYLDLAERRAWMNRDLVEERVRDGVADARRRVGQGDFIIPATPYLDQAERRLWMGGH